MNRYVFSLSYARRRIYSWFHWTHTVGVFMFYFFVALHGNGMMLQVKVVGSGDFTESILKRKRGEMRNIYSLDLFLSFSGP